MNNTFKISILHVIFLCLTSIGLKNHVTLLPPILETAKRDGWITVILTGIVIFPWILMIIFIQKKSQLQPMKIWLTEKIGKVGTNIALFSIVIFGYILAAFTLKETILWISSTFLESTPTTLLVLLYAIVCFLLVSTNIQTIVNVNTIILFFVIIFGFYAAFTNMQVKNYELIFPILEHGLSPVLMAMIYPASGFIELYMLLFLQHYFKKPLKWYHLGILIFCLVGLTLGPLIGAIVEFGPEQAAKMHFPAYEEWTLVAIGRFIEHMDFLSVYQWLSGAFIRIGVILFIVCDILNFTGQHKKIWYYMFPPFVIFNLALFLIEDEVFVKWNYHYIQQFAFIFIFLFSLFLIIVSLIPNRKATSERQPNQQNME
ncbi:GerAB/ArcD/ProY family transporter [Ureibacillus sp. FSL K6-2830]|uniref:GerAB/ArcD/ProY family transporter n=1 Tax=Ureibacillus sp. FSL K6-2830 TaxID=2954610 RepID=UPI0030F7A53B